MAKERSHIKYPDPKGRSKKNSMHKKEKKNICINILTQMAGPKERYVHQIRSYINKNPSPKGRSKIYTKGPGTGLNLCFPLEKKNSCK